MSQDIEDTANPRKGRDRLFELAGHRVLRRPARGDHIGAGLMRVLDRMGDAPAQVENVLGQTLRQARLTVALLGDETAYRGLEHSRACRWFMTPGARDPFPEEDHLQHSPSLTAQISSAYAKAGKNTSAAAPVDALRAQSPEFAALWDQHLVVGPIASRSGYGIRGSGWSRSTGGRSWILTKELREKAPRRHRQPS